ncbi:MAG: hypothetical protein Tsb009_26270 [Planctomycetaceae bacterium]
MLASDEQDSESPASIASGKEISGRWVIIGMFGFAILITATLWVYWKLHVGPFLPLQQALADRFPGSRPRVEGGRHKSHKTGSPNILRVTMKVDYNPNRELVKAEKFSRTVFEFVRKNWDLKPYDIFELHFYWPNPEEKIIERTFEFEL